MALIGYARVSTDEQTTDPRFCQISGQLAESATSG
jgi:DNA invertase Pin-like site-specific DNA recombinase